MTATFVLPAEEHLPAAEVPLLAGLAVRDAAAWLCHDQEIRVKWPNDLVYEGRKLAGLLCERVDGADLIGVGLNVNLDVRRAPAGLRGRITSLSTIAGRRFDLTDVLAAVARSLHERMGLRRRRPAAALLREYDRHHALVGRQIMVHLPGHQPPLCGLCEGIDQQGRLLVRRGAELHRVISGHVEPA